VRAAAAGGIGGSSVAVEDRGDEGLPVGHG
jgi:hypothetical protein